MREYILLNVIKNTFRLLERNSFASNLMRRLEHTTLRQRYFILHGDMISRQRYLMLAGIVSSPMYAENKTKVKYCADRPPLYDDYGEKQFSPIAAGE